MAEMTMKATKPSQGYFMEPSLTCTIGAHMIEGYETRATAYQRGKVITSHRMYFSSATSSGQAVWDCDMRQWLPCYKRWNRRTEAALVAAFNLERLDVTG